MEVLPKQLQSKKNYNVAGIIPVAGQPFDFNLPWHDCLMPIGQNFLAVEKAVFDCAIAGCDTIWIVCPQPMQPLIRYRLGDWILDPIKYFKGAKFGQYPVSHEIPIYYAPMHPKDVDRRDSLAWSVITGAKYAWHVGRKISRYTTPDKYFVTFPYGMFSSWWLQDYRSKIRTEVPFHVECNGKYYKEGAWLPFTFTPEDFIACRDHFRMHEKRGYDKNRERLSAEERYSGRYFTHDFVFSKVNSESANVCEVPWYYDIASWSGLKTWLASENKLDKPKDFILSYNEWNPLGENSDSDEL